MRLPISGIFLATSFLLIGCGGGGDDDNVVPDAAEQPDAPLTADASDIDAADQPDASDIDAGDFDAGDTDAATIDAGPACTATGDYIEQDDPNNDAFHGGGIEPSGLTIDGTTTSATIGGCIDPAFVDTADPPMADADVYQFSVVGARFISGRVTSSDPASEGGGVAIFDDQGNFIAGGTLASGDGPIAPAYLAAGDYFVAAYHEDTTLAAPYSYQLVLETLACAVAPPASYIEASDGNNNRGNDMFGVVYSPSFAMTATQTGGDAPEPTGLTFAAGDARLVRGTTAAVTSAGDEYLDRDTFAFTTGADPKRLIFTLAWNDTANDLDVIVVPENQIDVNAIVGYGGAIDGSRERGGAVLQPNTTYWIWVGNYTGSTVPATGLNYFLRLCTFQ